MDDADVIRVMADYESYPLWSGGGNTDPETLPISTALVNGLLAWADDFDATLDPDDPAASGFADAAAEEAFAEQGLVLARLLAAELDGEFAVEYFDPRTREAEPVEA